jgi:5-methylcytosine-specific restriction endonuclease McrA
MQATLKTDYDTLTTDRERGPAYYLARRKRRRQRRRGTFEARLARFREIAAYKPMSPAELVAGQLDPAYVSEFRFYEWNVLTLCVYCNARLDKRTVTRDHVIPRAAGGLSTPENLVPSCAACNRRKGSKPLWKFMLERN